MRSKRFKEARAHFIAVWEFHVRAGKQRRFEKAYGRDGNWARLFRRAEGYIRTELFHDPEKAGRYVTLDFWTSRLAFQKFKQRHIAAYKALDKRCESLTDHERRIGEFAKTVPQSRILSGGNSTTASSQITIRVAAEGDLPSLMALETQSPFAAHWNENAYREILNDKAPRRIVLISEKEDSVNGFVVARVDTDDCELENIVVAEHVQRQGIGFDLMQRLKTTSRALGVTQITLEVRESNRAARRLYEKTGFEISGRRKSYYRNPEEDAVLYVLKL